MPIPTVEEAARILRELLGRISKGATPQEVSRVCDDLDAFDDPASKFQILADPEYGPIRAEAKAARKELRSALSDAALDRMTARSAALEGYVKALDAVTTKTKGRAKALTMQWTTTVADAAARAISSAKEAKVAVEQGKSAEGIAAILRVLTEAEGIVTKAKEARSA